jgi:protein-tyrosine-phosphatase
LEEVQYGLLSNEAILIQDKKTAESNNELYNTTDQETVTLAKSFPETFAQPLVDAYKKATENYDEQFNQLRNDVGGYDAFLRSYLGNETQKSE